MHSLYCRFDPADVRGAVSDTDLAAEVRNLLLFCSCRLRLWPVLAQPALFERFDFAAKPVFSAARLPDYRGKVNLVRAHLIVTDLHLDADPVAGLEIEADYITYAFPSARDRPVTFTDCCREKFGFFLAGVIHPAERVKQF